MTREELRALVLRLSHDHKGDRDGGHALVAALKRAHEDLEARECAEFVQLLSEFVRKQEPELWAVALETLVQLGERQAVATLAAELIQSVPDGGRKDYVVLGLLRMNLSEVVAPVVEHIRIALRAPRPLTMPMTAALCKVDAESGLELASEYFESAYAAAQSAEVQGQIAAFVRNLVAIQERLLPELVRRVNLRRPNVGRWLARCIRDHLSKRRMVEDLGGERCRSLRDKIGAAEHTLN